MTPLRQRMIEDMQLRGLAPLTQRAYLRAVRALAHYYAKSPDLVTAEELRHYFLYLHDQKRLARATTTVVLCGLKFFFERTLQRSWPVLDLFRPRPTHKLPVVLSADEVWRVVTEVWLPAYRVCLSTIYTCGLRLSEGVQLRVDQIDSARMQLQIRGGKGNKDRYVPLPSRTLTLLRAHWRTHRNPVWLFPAGGPAGDSYPTATVPVSDRSVQRAFTLARQAAGLTKPATVHTLRHSWATHLMEAGVSTRVIQVWLGHRSPNTTALYTHLTQVVERQATDALGAITDGMPW